MTARTPVELVRQEAGGVYSRVGNRVQLEDAAGDVWPTPLPSAQLQNAIVTLAAADTEYLFAIPLCAGCEFRARTNVDVRYAFAPGLVAGPLDPYLTLAAGEQFHIEVPLAAQTLYLASAAAGTVIEVLVYGAV